MAAHINTWDHDSYEDVKSKREYDEYTVTAIKTAEDDYSNDRGVTLTLWVDAETGVVVSNISKYEASLTR